MPECNQKAYEWFLKAVLGGEGSKTAQYHLGLCQYLGLGCEEDEYAAYANFTDATEFGQEDITLACVSLMAKARMLTLWCL